MEEDEVKLEIEEQIEIQLAKMKETEARPDDSSKPKEEPASEHERHDTPVCRFFAVEAAECNLFWLYYSLSATSMMSWPKMYSAALSISQRHTRTHPILSSISKVSVSSACRFPSEKPPLSSRPSPPKVTLLVKSMPLRVPSRWLPHRWASCQSLHGRRDLTDPLSPGEHRE